MRDISEPDPHADAEVCEAHEEHHDVCDEEEVLGALLPPVQAVQVIVPHRAIAHPRFLALTISQSLELCILKSLSTVSSRTDLCRENASVASLRFMTQSLLVISSYQRGTE